MELRTLNENIEIGAIAGVEESDARQEDFENSQRNLHDDKLVIDEDRSNTEKQHRGQCGETINRRGKSE